MNVSRPLIGLTLLTLALGGCADGLRVASLDSATTATGARAAGQTAGSIGPISEVLGIDKYFPLQRTYTWTYRVTTTGTTTKTADEVTRIDSVTDLGSNKTAAYTTTRTEGATLVAQSTGTISQTPSQLSIASDGGTELISLPLQAGKEWASGTLSARSYSVERLVVQSKTYKDVMAIAYSKDGETRAVRWLAPGVGIVKQVARVTSDGEVTTVTSELTSARVSAVTAVSLAPLALSLGKNATASVTASVLYDDSSVGREVSFAVADPGLATVTSAGLVTAGGSSGTTVLTARSTQDSTKAATLSIVVN